MEDVCSICLDEIKEEECKKLECSHNLHLNCYQKLLFTPGQKKCPLCRCDIFKNKNICEICNFPMNIDPASCDVLVSEECGCIYHYGCLKKNKIYKCKNCNKYINTENVHALSYTYFERAHLKWIGPILKCKISSCNQQCNPQRFGYCINHTDALATNKAVVLSFVYVTKFVYEEDPEIRAKIFIKLLEYMHSNHRYDDVEDVDFYQIRNNVNKFNVLHN